MHYNDHFEPALALSCGLHEATPKKSIRIAIADDCEFVRTALCEYLGLVPGFELVGQARDGREALQLLATTEVDVLILDLSMPRMTGIQVLQELSRLGYKVRILVHSSHRADQVGGVVTGLGASAYLEKGCPPERIVSTIRSVADGTCASAMPGMPTLKRTPEHPAGKVARLS